MTPPPDYLPPPVACEPLAAIVGRFGGSIARRGGAATFDFGTPAEASPEIKALLAAQVPTEQGVEAVARLPEGRVFGDGIVLAPDGRSIARDVSLEFGRPAGRHWLLADKKIRPPQTIAGVTAVIASTLAEGYCHWLLDELPRLLLLRSEEWGNTLIAHATAECGRTALRLRGWTGTLLPPVRRAHVQCEELVVPSLVGWTGRATPRQVELIRGFVEPLHTPTAAVARMEKIYVSRRSARRRRVVNEPALIAALATRGFVSVQLEELTWGEQINLFRNAKVIVAPHGAGLANLVFCAAGVRVVECFNRAYVHGCFWQLAAIRGLDYRPLVPPGDSPLGQIRARNRDDLEADVAQVLAAIKD